MTLKKYKNMKDQKYYESLDKRTKEYKEWIGTAAK